MVQTMEREGFTLLYFTTLHAAENVNETGKKPAKKFLVFLNILFIGLLFIIRRVVSPRLRLITIPPIGWLRHGKKLAKKTFPLSLILSSL